MRCTRLLCILPVKIDNRAEFGYKRRMKLKSPKSFGVCIISLIFVFDCLGFSSQAYEELKQPKDRVFGDWLVTELGAEPSTLNPITSTDAYSGTIDSYIYESLL